ncbi:hypothetical protein RRG08_004227 [Elysia crispata]|uniref:Uncharacterized protein n=1 Tax=Elysia crispata TaxID=231223 RepID=A0AAE0ZKN2_9GAST|nr:hypothetical protein RRG08_004227 [Elysia crispata]
MMSTGVLGTLVLQSLLPSTLYTEENVETKGSTNITNTNCHNSSSGEMHCCNVPLTINNNEITRSIFACRFQTPQANPCVTLCLIYPRFLRPHFHSQHVSSHYVNLPRTGWSTFSLCRLPYTNNPRKVATIECKPNTFGPPPLLAKSLPASTVVSGAS